MSEFKISLNDINELHLIGILENSAPVFTHGAGRRMKLMRMELKLDQAQLGKLLGVGAKTICGAENGARVQRNPILMTKLISVFGLRRVLYILTNRYAAGYEEAAKGIHTRYWESKHAPQGYRVPYEKRPHLAIGRSKDELLRELNSREEELKNLKLVMEDLNKRKKNEKG